MAGVKTATGMIAAYMRGCRFYGWASFWNVIYVLPGHVQNVGLLCRYGYYRNPYEVENEFTSFILGPRG